MKELSRKQFTDNLIKNLKNFDTFCKKHKLTYFLMYGTLIGAARHKGFIPWDDDIDVIMPRPDYEKLERIFNDENNRYRLISQKTTKGYNAPLAKVVDTATILKQDYGYRDEIELGAYIDIFVLDGMPDNERDQKKHLKTATKLSDGWIRSVHVFHYKGSTFMRDLLRYIRYLPKYATGYKKYLTKIQKHSTKYSYDSSNYVANLSFITESKCIYKKSDFQKIYLDFEGMKMPCPKGYDAILTDVYGDWRKLPPKEKQISNHDFSCYAK